MCGKRCYPWTSSLIKPFVQYFPLAWSSPESLSGRSLICSRGWFNDKTSLLLAWLLHWSQTLLVQNIKASQNPVLHSAGHLQRWAAAEGSHEADSIALDPVQRFIIVLLLLSVLPSCQVQLSSGKHKITSVQGSLYPSHLQENNKADVSAAEKNNPAWAVPLNQALNQYENQAQLFFAKTFFFFS